jgi:hypothetical protein
MYPVASSARGSRRHRRHGDPRPRALGLTPARKAFLVQLRALALERAGGCSRTKRSQSPVGDDSQRLQRGVLLAIYSAAHTINAVAELSTSQLEPAFYELISEDAACGGGLVKS